MHSFASLPHCLLSAVFQSCRQILLWHFQGLYVLQPITGGTTSIILSFHNLPISLFKSWYFSTLSFSFSLLLHHLVQQYRLLSPFALSCQLKLRLVFLPTSSHWTLISHNTFTYSFSTAPSGTCSCQFSVCSKLFFLQRSQWTFFATLSCHLLYSFWVNFSHPLAKFCTLSLVSPHNLHRWFSLVLSMWCFP